MATTDEPNDVTTASTDRRPNAFASRGFYLHTSWSYAHPFAVRTWSRSDFAGMFQWLRLLAMDRVMFWPLHEVMPAPLSEADRAVLRRHRQSIEDARAAGLECWIVSTPNLRVEAEAAAHAYEQRHFYPLARSFRLDDAQQRHDFLAHRAKVLNELNNADGYVTIDGDPGGYAGAQPDAYLDLLRADRAVLDRVGTQPDRQKLVPWLWSGWGKAALDNPWLTPLRPLMQPVLDRLAAGGLPGPWELLPGRSHREEHANGREVVQLTDDAGLLDRSTLLLYEVVEFEPTPPAFIVQFDLIRHAMRREARLAGRARGCMANAQQPVVVLQNLFFFARAAADFDYLDRTDEQVLTDFAEFLGGPAAQLLPAWRALDLPLHELDPDLSRQLRALTLDGAPAGFIPGGPVLYLDLLASFVETRRGTLQALTEADGRTGQRTAALAEAVGWLYQWWLRHRYVFTGHHGEGFRLAWTHPRLLAPLQQWSQGQPSLSAAELAAALVGTTAMERDVAERVSHDLLGSARPAP